MSNVIVHLTGNQKNGFYEQFLYTAGEMQVRLTPEGIESLRGILPSEELCLVARISSASDIMELLLLEDALSEEINLGACPINLVLPYLPYSRADRRFTRGDCAGLARFGQLLSLGRFEKIFTLDVHSPAALECIPRLVDISPWPLISRAISKFASIHGTERVTVLFPDKGAARRYTIPDSVAYNQTTVAVTTAYCKKEREPVTGELLGFEVPKLPRQPAIVVDDICDGGRTFIGIAQKIRDSLGPIPLGLYVTHGIFSSGFNRLLGYYDRIFTTNTIPQPQRPPEVVDVVSADFLLFGNSNVEA